MTSTPSSAAMWRQLTPANLLSWPVVAVISVWSAVVHFTDGRVLAHGFQPGRVLAWVIAQTALVAAMWIATRPVPLLPPRARPVAVLAAIVVACGARGATLSLSLGALDVADDGTLPVYIAAAIASLSVPMVIMTIAVGMVRDHRAMRTALLAEQAVLTDLTVVAAEQVRQVDEEAVAVIQRQLIATLQPVANGDAAVALNALRSAIDDVARPISHALQESSQHWNPPTGDAPPVGLDWGSALRQAFRPETIRPFVIAIVIAFANLGASFAYNGVPRTAVLSVYAVVGGSAVLWLTRAGAIRLERRLPGALRPLLFFGALLVGGLTLAFGTLLITSGAARPAIYLVQAPLFIVMAGAVVAFIRAATMRASSVEQELRAMDADLRWSLVRMRETERQHKRALAHVLHGRVQSALSAAYLRITALSSSDAADPSVIAGVRADVDAAIDALSAQLVTPSPLVDTIVNTQETWAGIADVTFEVPPDVLARIAADPIAVTTLNDLVPELCFNAIKHASAEHIAFAVALVDERTLRVTVTNDGRPVRDTAEPGLGDQLLQEATLSWRRHHTAAVTTTEASIPLG